MKLKCMVLKTSYTANGSVQSSIGGQSFINPHSHHRELTLEEVALPHGEISELVSDTNTKAIAPLMPVNLIAPMNTRKIDNLPLAKNTWGIEATRASDSPYDGSDVTVAVLDTGIDPEHPAFANVTLVQRNFTDDSDNDQNGHGTHCAGTIFGREVGSLRIGIAPNIKRALIGKVLGAGGGSSATIARAIQWASNEGANVISMSLGIDFPGYVKYLIDQEDLEVEPATSLALEAYRANVNMFSELTNFIRAKGAFETGTLVVAASGNESRRPEYNIAVSPPAAGTGIIAVGALQQNAGGVQVASFSNTGVDISAPGVDVISAMPGGGLASMSGTSMATPHIAGLAALWAQRELQTVGNIGAEQLKSRLLASGVTKPFSSTPKPDDVGTGLAQAPLIAPVS